MFSHRVNNALFCILHDPVPHPRRTVPKLGKNASAVNPKVKLATLIKNRNLDALEFGESHRDLSRPPVSLCAEG